MPRQVLNTFEFKLPYLLPNPNLLPNRLRYVGKTAWVRPPGTAYSYISRASDMPLLETKTFWARVSDLHKSLTSDNGWNDAETLAIPAELPPSDEITFSKSSAFFIHLFGLELYGSLVILCKEALHIVAPDKTCAMLEGLRHGRPIQCPNLLLHRLFAALCVSPSSMRLE